MTADIPVTSDSGQKENRVAEGSSLRLTLSYFIKTSNVDPWSFTERQKMLIFEWDPKKGKSNLGKHGVSFDEASTAFKDPLSLTIDDPLHSNDEDRTVLIGISYKNRILVVVHTERGDNIRIISARKAVKKERKYYESNV